VREFSLCIFGWLLLSIVRMDGVRVAILSFDPLGISFRDFTGYSGMDIKEIERVK